MVPHASDGVPLTAHVGRPAARTTTIGGNPSMTIEFTGRKIVITPALKAHAEEKLKKLARVLDGIIEAHVILSVEKHRHSAEIVVHARHATMTGSETTEDLYASIGKVLDKLERQAKKLKDKYSWGRKRVKGLTTIRSIQEVDEAPPAQDGPQIVRTRRYAVKPMTIDEAILEVTGSKNSFLVFRDAHNQKVSVVYRRNDGNFGLIEPEL